MKYFITKKDKKYFWSKVNKSKKCWLWLAGLNNGYGQIQIRGQKFKTHRFSYMLCVGPITDNLNVSHKCNNKNCVNPKHLYLTTQKECITKSVKNGNSKLTKKQVLKIRLLYETTILTQKDLASKFNVHVSTVMKIITRKNWKHV